MIRIKVDTGNGAYQYLELLPNLSFEKVNQFYKFSELEYGRTQSFKLPRTENNERILEDAGQVYEYGDNMRREIKCRIQYGALEKSGKITIEAATDKDYSCTLYYELSDMLDYVNDRKIGEYGVGYQCEWSYENTTPANDPILPSKMMAVVPYVSECPERFMMKDEWCWFPSFNIRRAISNLFHNAQSVTQDYNTRLYQLFDEVPQDERDIYWMTMNENNRGVDDEITFRMRDNRLYTPLGQFESIEFKSVKAFTDLYNGGHQHGGQRYAWSCNQEITITIPEGFPSDIILASPQDRWSDPTEITDYYYNLKNGRPVHAYSSGSATVVPGDIIVIPADTNFNFYSLTDLRWVDGYRKWMFSQNYQGGDYALSVGVEFESGETIDEGGLFPAYAAEYKFKWNAPDMTLLDLCKIYGTLTNTVLTFEDNELRFLKDAGYHELPITDCVSFTNLERSVGDWSIDEVIDFDSGDDDNIVAPVKRVYHTQNTARDQSENVRTLKASESYGKMLDSYYGDGPFTPAPTRLAIHDCDVEYEDETEQKIKKVKPDMKKPVVCILQNGDIRTLKRVSSLPINPYYQDLCDQSTKVKAKWRMPIEDYIKLDHTYRFTYRGLKYVWLDAKWNNGIVECTLQQSNYENVNEYYINVTWTNGGDAGTSGYAREGDTWFIWARASEGFEFSHWELDGQELQGEGSDFSFTVTGNAHFHAVFLGDECTITTSTDPNGAGQTSGGGTYRAGDVCTVHATDNGGYRFREWTESGETVSTDRNYQFVVTRNRTLVAEYDTLEKYNVNVSVSPNGVAQYYGDGSYYEGTTCTVGVTTNQRAYAFMGWTDLDSGQIVSLSTSFSFVVERDWNLEATYFGGCTVTTSCSPVGAGNTYGDGFYNDGDSVTVGFNPNQSYTFSHWEYAENPGVSVSSNNPYTFTIHQNTYLVAVCNQQGVKVAVNIIPNGGGTVTGVGEFVSGQTCTLVATPAAGYGFSRYEINGSTVSSNATYSFTVTSDTVVDAIFYNLGYIVTVAANPVAGGTVTGGGTYQYGQSVTITATPSQNYSFTGWYKQGQLVSTSYSYTFTVTQSAAFTAQFQGQKCNIRTGVYPNGSGETSGAGSYTYGSSVTVTATAYNGYTFLRWEENGTTVSSNASYTFTATSNRTLTAVFQTKEKHNISASTNPVGIAQITGTGSYYTGDTVQLTAISSSDRSYFFQSWTENGTVVSTNNPYSFTCTGDRTLVANYSQFVTPSDNDEEEP